MKNFLVLLCLLALASLPLYAQGAIEFSFTPNSDSTTSGYIIGCGTVSGTYTSTFPITGETTGTGKAVLACGSTWYCAIAATATGLQSAWSAPLPQALICPPTNFKITGTSISQITSNSAVLTASANKPSSMSLSVNGKTYRAFGVEVATFAIAGLKANHSYPWTLTARWQTQTATATGMIRTP
jgi:hypothetical protein